MGMSASGLTWVPAPKGSSGDDEMGVNSSSRIHKNRSRRASESGSAIVGRIILASETTATRLSFPFANIHNWSAVTPAT